MPKSRVRINLIGKRDEYPTPCAWPMPTTAQPLTPGPRSVSSARLRVASAFRTT